MDHQNVLRQAFLLKFLPQWLHCSCKQGRVAGGRWSGTSGGPRYFIMLGLCLCLQCGCSTSSWWKECWSRSCRGRWQVAKGTKGNSTNMPSSITKPPPSSPAGTCRTSTRLLLPKVLNYSSYSSYKIVRGIWFCNPDRTWKTEKELNNHKQKLKES